MSLLENFERYPLTFGPTPIEHLPRLTEALGGKVALKGGAEGVTMGALPDRGIGFALKCEDGSGRGVEEAVAAVLHHLGVTDEVVSPNSPITNHAGRDVGIVTVALQ